MAASFQVAGQEVHKFDVTEHAELSRKQIQHLENTEFFNFIRNLREELGEEELIRLLKLHSAAVGRRFGERQAQTPPDSDFQTFTATFPLPRYANSLTHEVFTTISSSWTGFSSGSRMT